jgi:serine/threonine protein kinase
MGIVHRVHDLVADRELALKRISDAQAPSKDANDTRAQATLARFRREYHTLSELAHPNIIEVYDFGIDEVGPYYTMELLDGSDLREVAPLPWQKACAVLRDVAAALALLHSRRLLHRDISPRNVYRTRNGRAKLIDFGAMSPMGFERILVGTPPFIPPESVARQALDGRADIYALGALAYFVLTGRQAYPARTLADLREVWRAQPRLPSASAREVPEAVDALVMRMLSLDPQGRPGTAIELVDRFTSLAGLDLDDVRYATDVQAYLTSPTLVGGRARYSACANVPCAGCAATVLRCSCRVCPASVARAFSTHAHSKQSSPAQSCSASVTAIRARTTLRRARCWNSCPVSCPIRNRPRFLFRRSISVRRGRWEPRSHCRQQVQARTSTTRAPALNPSCSGI